MTPALAERGRVITQGFLGFGGSDKFVEPSAYTVGRHYDTVLAFLEALKLDGLTLVAQDWGGLLGLRAAAEQPERFARLVPMNTGLPDGTPELPEVWHEFARTVANAEELDIARLVDAGCVTSLSEAVRAAYDAPFPNESYKAGARRFTELMPQSPDDPGAEAFRAARETLSSWEKPAFVLFSDSDPITSRNRDPLRELLPTAKDQPDVWIEGAGHFLQEDAGEAVAEEIVDFVDRTPLEG
jgi:haloalkane dehalogenase